MKIEEGFAIGMKFSELCKKEKDMNNLSKEYTDFCKKKWVAVDDEFVVEIKTMLLLIAANTKEGTQGEDQLEQWQEYFKPITEKQSGGN